MSMTATDKPINPNAQSGSFHLGLESSSSAERGRPGGDGVDRSGGGNGRGAG